MPPGPYIFTSVIAETIPQLNALSSDEKIILAAELWRDAVGEGVENPGPALVQALRERLDFYREHPDQVSTWEAVRARIVSRKPS
jgi:putative addiction module component (TIGR02574 family)